MDNKFSLGSYDDVFSTRAMSFDSNPSQFNQILQENSENYQTERSNLELELPLAGLEAIKTDETSAIDFAPAPTLPDNFPSSRSASVFRVLWQKVWSVQRYRDYRYGHSMSQKAKKERNKWPFQSEEAFWRACACIPPRHRRKEPYPGRAKTLGRNEAIAAYINDTLGLVPNPDGSRKAWPKEDKTPEELQELTRKNISSHLQVLRPWFHDTDKFVFNWISGDHGEESPSRRGSSPVSRDQRRYSSFSIPYPGARLSNPADSYAKARKRSGEPPAVLPMLRSQHDSRATNSIDYFKFSMFSQGCRFRHSDSHTCARQSTCVLEKLHVFTKTTAGGGMPDTNVPESSLRQRFPTLAQANPNQHQNSGIVFAEASLALPSQEYALGSSVDLGIDGRFATKHMLDPSSRWYCRTTFFDAAEFQMEQEQRLEEINGVATHGIFSHYLPFASGYWAGKLSDFISTERRAKALECEYQTGVEESQNTFLGGQRKPSMALRTIKDLREKIPKSINRLSAKQEILEYPLTRDNNHDSNPVTHLIICWKFRLTQSSEQGITQFRNIAVRPTDGQSNTSRQQSPEKPLVSHQLRPENGRHTQSPYSDSSQSFKFAPSEMPLDGPLFGSYDFSNGPMYQHLFEERPCSSLSNVKTVASTNSSMSLEEFPEYQDGLNGRHMPMENLLGAGTPPTFIMPDQQIQGLNLFNGTENLSFGEGKLSQLGPNELQDFNKAFNYQGENLHRPTSSYSSNPGVFQMAHGSAQNDLNRDTRQSISNEGNTYATMYYDPLLDGVANNGIMYSSEGISRSNQQNPPEDQYFLNQPFMLE